MNPVLDTIMNRASIRSFKQDPVPAAVLEQLALAARQAPFTGQMCSLVAVSDPERRAEIARHFGQLVVRAPLFVLALADVRKLEKFVAARGRTNRLGDLDMLFLAIQDAAYAAQNLVLAAESLGLGSVYLGAAPWVAPALVELLELPPRVYPLVGLCLGYPAEQPPPRPRIPLEHVLFQDRYRDLDAEAVEQCLEVMDAGLIREGYYVRLGGRIETAAADDVPDDRYGWGEHVSRKYGEALGRLSRNLTDNLAAQGFDQL